MNIKLIFVEAAKCSGAACFKFWWIVQF